VKHYGLFLPAVPKMFRSINLITDAVWVPRPHGGYWVLQTRVDPKIY
jgi:hypothetical protein